jgi:XTP/dITP diphosphohydrolase
MNLYCATGNRGKLREFRQAAGAAPVEIELIPNFKEIPPCVEDGATFEANAVIKAEHYGAYLAESAGPVLLFADDSGLEVDALGGAPGVFSARYCGYHGNDEANNRLLLERLDGVENRTARFVCAIALVEGGALKNVYRGSVEGRIIHEARGAGGFGYDPLFYYPPFGRTFGEAGADEKFAVSHRGQALRAMLADLKLL